MNETTPASAPLATDRVFTVPNAISAARLLLVPVFAIMILTKHDVWAFAILVFSGLSDWLDGVLARKLNQTSKLGQLLDPAADRLFIIVTLLGLAWREIIPWWLVAIILLRELVLGINLAVLSRHNIKALPVHFVGKAGTLAMMYAFPALLLSSLDGAVGAVFWTVGWAFAIWGVGLYWLAAAVYLKQTRDILRSSALAAA